MPRKTVKGKSKLDDRGYNKSSIASSKNGSPALPSATVNATTGKATVSGKTHDSLVQLLDKVKLYVSSMNQNQKEVLSPSVLNYYSCNNKVFVRKVGKFYDQLVELKFHPEQIENVLYALLTSTRPEIDESKKETAENILSIEAALDWLCLHLPSHELPPLFTEEALRLSSTQDPFDDGTVTVLMPQKRLTNETDHLYNTLPVELSSCKMVEEEEESHWKSWILDQYMYEEESITDEISLQNKPEYEETLAFVTDSQSLIISDDTSSMHTHLPILMASEHASTVDVDKEEMQGQCKSKDLLNSTEQGDHIPIYSFDELDIGEKRLGALNQQIQEIQEILMDDATAYMRRKDEIAQLKKKLRKLERAAANVKEKIDEQRQMILKGASVEGDFKEVSCDDHLEGSLLQMFEDNPISSSSISSSGITARISPKMVATQNESHSNINIDSAYSTIQVIPKGWTGTTPKQLLLEYCRKNKLEKPIFKRLEGYSKGCCLMMCLSSQSTIEHERKKGECGQIMRIEMTRPCYSFRDSEELASVEALYQLQPNIALYHVFPPILRDLWKSWLDEVDLEKTATRRENEIKKEQIINSITQSVLNRLRQRDVSKPYSDVSNAISSGDSVDLIAVPDDWEVSDFSESDSKVFTSMISSQVQRPSHEGIRLRDEFLKHRKTAGYETMCLGRKALPIYEHRDNILTMIQHNPVLVLCAETGSGKTTQCPQFVLEDALMSGYGDRVSILCTQPRRIAAIAVAERVAEEMCITLGDQVGYQIRMDAKKSHSTKLLFCTTGIILRRLQDDPFLKDVTHVFVDEVHERQWQSDFLLAVLRRLLQSSRRDLKIILMSATVDPKLFCEFFSIAPCLSIPGRVFPVNLFYLEDILDATDHIIEEGSQYAKPTRELLYGATIRQRNKISDLTFGDSRIPEEVPNDFLGNKPATRRSMTRVDEKIVNYDLIEDLLFFLFENSDRNAIIVPPSTSLSALDDSKDKLASVLVFLPGIGEIRSLYDRLMGSKVFGDSKRFVLIPMHSSLSTKDQRRLFEKPGKGCHKIILATNIAETSVTIPDCSCVIDTGLVRELRQDDKTFTPMLVTDLCSLANAKQRAGRAGRVGPGICCKLFSSRTEKRMRVQSVPEIKRISLDEACLALLAGRLGNNCYEFFNDCPEPPQYESIVAAVTVLQDVGAVEVANSEDFEIHKLTELGSLLAKLPVHVRIGKMLLFGSLFSALDKVLTVAASLASKSPFASPFDKSQLAYSMHQTFRHPHSDFLTVCNAYGKYVTALKAGPFQAKNFCDKCFLDQNALKEIRDTRQLFLDHLREIGFIFDENLTNSDQVCKSEVNIYGENDDVVTAAICAGLYPNVAHALMRQNGDYPAIWHRNERLYLHNSSVNYKIKRLTEWLLFNKKLATDKTYISETCTVNPFSLILFGRQISVRHTEKKVIVDDWIELHVVAQTGLLWRELRILMNHILSELYQCRGKRESIYQERKEIISDIVRLINYAGSTT